MSRPLNQSAPAVGVWWPEIMLMKVVLPAPLGPMMQRISPASSEKSISLLATRPRKVFVSESVRSSSAIAGAPRCRPTGPPAERAGHAAAEEDDDRDEQRAEDERPIGRDQRAQIVGQERHADRREKGAQQARSPADRHPDHDLGGEQHAAQRRRHEARM